MHEKAQIWEDLEPSWLRIYRDSFSQEEIDSVLDYYKTTTGK